MTKYEETIEIARKCVTGNCKGCPLNRQKRCIEILLRKFVNLYDGVEDEK